MLTEFEKGYNKGVQDENERGNPELLRLRKLCFKLQSDLRADQVAFEAIHELHPELGLNERANYINFTLNN